MMMSRHRDDNDRSPSRALTAETRALWLLLAAGVALLLAAAAVSGEERGFTATRTDRFQGPLPPGARLRVSNVNGDIVATAGREFSAVVTTTVMASRQDLAGEILEKTRVVQTSGNDEYRLETQWPGSWGRAGGSRRQNSLFCRECRIASRYELVVPPGFAANLQTVNGEVRVNGVDGDLEVHSVNGNLQILGVLRSLGAQTVNGKVEVTAAALPSAASWQLQTVNGGVTATLPKDARFAWNASTMSGTIASTFALPPLHEEAALAPLAPAAPPGPREGPRRAPRPSVTVVNDDDPLVDMDEIEREIEESLREVEIKAKEVEWTSRKVLFSLPERRYSATFGGGGAKIRSSTLNGSITLLAAGTREAEAKPLVSSRRTVVVTVPRVVHVSPEVRVRVPVHRVEAVPHPEAPEAPEDEEPVEIVRGDIAGDLLSTSNGSYQVGNVSGRVRILTHAGEIHIASAGSGADIKTFGGDIRIGRVQGDFRAQTLAGDVRAGNVAGSARAETAGGDIRIDRVAGLAIVRTGGGDIVLPAVGGAIDAQTGGGEVRIGVLARTLKNGISIRNAGGDVVLTLPADFRGELDLEVDGSGDSDDISIRSEFPGLALTRGTNSQSASGVLNGGGPRVLVRTSSGSIRVLRGPATGS
jgi:DUF4097 and DUF4098 domain-containing protein YvlB